MALQTTLWTPTVRLSHTVPWTMLTMTYVFCQGNAPKFDLQVNRRTDFKAWKSQCDVYSAPKPLRNILFFYAFTLFYFYPYSVILCFFAFFFLLGSLCISLIKARWLVRMCIACCTLNSHTAKKKGIGQSITSQTGTISNPLFFVRNGDYCG